MAEIAMRQGIESNQHLRAATPAFGQLERILGTLRAARHAPFHWRSRCEAMLGQTIAEPSGPDMGRIETASIYKVPDGNARAIEVSGIAEHDGLAAECFVLADGNRTAIGSGAPLSSGWQGVATLPEAMPLCAFALFPGEDALRRLGGCQSIASPATP